MPLQKKGPKDWQRILSGAAQGGAAGLMMGQLAPPRQEEQLPPESMSAYPAGFEETQEGALTFEELLRMFFAKMYGEE